MRLVRMSRLEKMFEKKEGAAFMPYVCCGDPSWEFTLALVKTLVENGADAIELGIPFSDPIADGKTIQGASQRALAAGMTPKKAIGAIAKLREEGVAAPIVAMTYYNIIYSAGTAQFLRALSEAGADGLIVPDVPLEESEELRRECKAAGLDFISLITPNCTDARLEKIAAKAGGFLYAVSVLGTTGARESVDASALELVKRAKKLGLPVCAGFGISRPAHAGEFAKAGADGVIVGSEIVNIYSKHIGGNGIDAQQALEEIAAYANSMKNSCTNFSEV